MDTLENLEEKTEPGGIGTFRVSKIQKILENPKK